MEKPLNRQILSLALPAIVANITTPLLSLMDVAIVGHMAASAIAAIAVGGTVFNMVYWLFGFLRMGSSGLTAQALGSGDGRRCADVRRRALAVALCAGLALVLLSRLVFAGAMGVMDVEGETRQMADTYFSVLIFGAPAVLGTYALLGYLLGMQRARAAMAVSITINVVNVVVSLLLVFVFGMGIAGVAAGTLSAQWTGFVMAYALGKRKIEASASETETTSLPLTWGRFFKVNTDIFLRTLCIIAVTVWFTRAGAAQGTVVLAVNTLLMQFFTLFSHFIDGFANAGEALCGKEKGSGDVAGLRRTVRALLAWSGGLGLLFSGLYMAGGTWLVDLLCSDGEVVRASREFLPWVALVPIVSFAAFTYDGIYIGTTRTRWMLASMAVATAVYFAVYFLLAPVMGNHGLWLAFLSYLLVRGVVLGVADR